jgi:hypothetical protein
MSIRTLNLCFKEKMEAKTMEDRIHGSLFLMKAINAQLNAFMLTMNKDYMVLMSITLFQDLIYKFISPTVSQYVVVALVRAGMVHGNKFLWEMLICKKQWALAQEANWLKQKSTIVQLNEKVDEKVEAKMESAVPDAM